MRRRLFIQALLASTSLNISSAATDQSLVELEMPMPAEELRNRSTAAVSSTPGKFGVMTKCADGSEFLLPVVADATLRKDTPAESQGAQPLLVLRIGRHQQAVLKVDTSPLKGKEIKEASFQFYPVWMAKSSQEGTVSFHRMLVDWSEKATWEKPDPSQSATWQGLKPGVHFEAKPFARFETRNLEGGKWNLAAEFTEQVKAWANGTVPDYGFVAILDGKTEQVNLSSREKVENEGIAAVENLRKSKITIGGADDIQPVIHFNLPLLQRALLHGADDLEEAQIQWNAHKLDGDLKDATLCFHRMLTPQPGESPVSGKDYEATPFLTVPLETLKLTGSNKKWTIGNFAPALRKWISGEWASYGALARITAAPGNALPMLEATSAVPADNLKKQAAKLTIRMKSEPSHFVFTHEVQPQNNVYTVVENGHLNYGGKRLRLWGINLQSGSLTSSTVVHTVQRFRKLGYNAVRVWGPAAYSADSARIGELQTTTKGDGSALDVFDRFVAECKKNGIFIYCTSLHYYECHSRSAPDALLADDSFIAGGDDWPQWKQAIAEARKDKSSPLRFFRYFDERIQKVNQKHISNFLNHVNPYTGKRYAEEETFAMFALQNENGFLKWVPEKGFATWPAYFRDKLRHRWNRWLKEKYRTEESLIQVWGKADPGESLANGSIEMKPLYSERNQYPKTRGEDFMRFLIEVVDGCNQQTRAYCRSQAPEGVGVNVIPFIFDTLYTNNVPWLYADAQADVSAVGIYSWTLTSALTTPPSLYVLDSNTVQNKPTVIYEINSGRPNPYRSEYPMKVAAYTAWQDWDGVFWYTFDPIQRDSITDEQYLIEPLLYMNSDHYWTAIHSERDPLISSAIAAAGQIFRSGAIKPAPAPNLFHLGGKAVHSFDFFNGLGQAIPAFQRGSRIIFDKDPSAGMRMEGPVLPTQIKEAVVPSEDIQWDWPNGRLIIDTPTAKAYVGRVNGPYHFKDGLVLSGLNTPFVTFAMSSLDGRPIVQAGDSGRYLVSAMFDARNTGFEFDSSKAIAGGGFVPPGDQVRMIRSRGNAPVVLDQVSYSLSFPTRLDYQLKEYDFALRAVSDRTTRDSNVLTVGKDAPFVSLLEISRRGAVAEAFIAPEPIAKTESNVAVTAPRQSAGGSMWSPIACLRWDSSYASAHQALRESALPFSSISPIQNVSDGSIMVSDAEMLFGAPANLELIFQNGQLTRIGATFTRSPNLEEVVSTYKKELGQPVQETIVAEAYATSKVRWIKKQDDAELEVTVTETQGSSGITCDLTVK